MHYEAFCSLTFFCEQWQKIQVSLGVVSSIEMYSMAKNYVLATFPGSGRRSKITKEVKAIVDKQMSKDKTTAYQLLSVC